MTRASSDPGVGVAHVGRDDAGYPKSLLRLGRPPARLWYRGTIPADLGGSGRRAVALVGSRAASGAGCKRAFALARELGAAGITIVSGGAYGIDAAAHEGALAVGAPTAVVLGCGVDVVYPDRHRDLFTRVVGSGGVLLSELQPGFPPRANHFPSRNRIIAALSLAVVVVEAELRSGSLITARCAVDIGIPVLASTGSPGADCLLAMPKVATLRQSADVLDVLEGRFPSEPGPQQVFSWPSERDPLCQTLRAMGRATPESLASRLDLPIGEVMGLLGQAELEGRVRRSSGGLYEVSRIHG